MSRLDPAIRLRRRQLDALSLALAAEERGVLARSTETNDLEAQRFSERRAASSALPCCEPWFARSADRLGALADAQEAATIRLADLRSQVVQARARLKLLESARSENLQFEHRQRQARSETALLDLIAAGWGDR